MLQNLVVVAAYDKQFIDSCLKSLGNKYPVLVMDTSSGGHPTGAYLRAYQEHPAKHYLFIQDSMVALVPNYVEPFAALMPKRGAVAWGLFKQGFDTGEQDTWAHTLYEGEYPGVGIFGPIFYTSRESLQELDKKGLLPPVPRNKAEAQTCERLWSWAFYNAGMKLESVGGWWDDGCMKNGTYPVFQKTFAGRK